MDPEKRFQAHCRGQVLIEYNDPETVIDVGLEEELLRNGCINSIVEARKNCTTRIAADDMYDTWKSAGLVFGKLFQTVLGMLVDHKSDQAVARICSTVPLLKKLMPFQYARHHFIHPPTLDATLQVCLPPIISNPEQKVKNAITPMFIKELWVSGTENSDREYLATAKTKKTKAEKVQTKLLEYGD